MLKPTKNYSNQEIAELLTNIATAYEIKNKNYFRIVSYQNAADSISSYPQSIQDIWSKNPKDLDAIPNLGPAILEKINYLFEKNRYHPAITKAFENIHPAVFTFTKINSIGPKIAHKLTKNLEFSSQPETALENLLEYAKKGLIRHLEGMGEKSEKAILDNTLNYLGRKDKMSYPKAKKISDSVIKFLQLKFPDLIIEPLGSLRRHAKLVGDIDIAVQSDAAQDILDHFITYPQSVQTIARGPKKASIRLHHDIRVDLMIQPKSTWGSLLQHFTGSRQHNIELRRFAQTKGYSLSEYGIKDLRTGQTHVFSNEKDFYNFLGLNFIKPQDRIGENEIEKAKK